MTAEALVFRRPRCSILREPDGRWTVVYRVERGVWQQGPLGSFWVVVAWALARGLLW